MISGSATEVTHRHKPARRQRGMDGCPLESSERLHIGPLATEQVGPRCEPVLTDKGISCVAYSNLPTTKCMLACTPDTLDHCTYPVESRFTFTCGVSAWKQREKEAGVRGAADCGTYKNMRSGHKTHSADVLQSGESCVCRCMPAYVHALVGHTCMSQHNTLRRCTVRCGGGCLRRASLLVALFAFRAQPSLMHTLQDYVLCAASTALSSIASSSSCCSSMYASRASSSSFSAVFFVSCGFDAA